METKKVYNEKVIITEPSQVYKECVDILSEKKELFIAFFLDGKNTIIAREIIHIGTLNQCLVHPREVFRSAILHAANSIILAHNHPSGDPTPSKEDILIDKRLREAGEIVGIAILDDIVVGKDGYKSIKDEE